MTYTLHTGDCRDVMATLPAESVDAIVCDPPYGLSFMGKGWDHGVPGVDFWVEALRVLKPGGHLIAFGGTRTYHRLAVAIEDAGFEVRDCLMWLYGSGFPKSHDVSKAMDKQAGAVREVVTEVREDMFGKYEKVIRYKAATQTGVMSGLNGSAANEQGHTYATITAPSTDLAKQWQGWGTALKPAYEPAILARKPLRGTVADNVAQWGVGGLNIDGCRVGDDVVGWQGAQGGSADVTQSQGRNYRMSAGEPRPVSGRWPANVILDEEAAAALDEQSGVLKSGKLEPHHKLSAGKNYAMSGDNQERFPRNSYGGDTGGASRFFYTAKASRSEREAGLDGVEMRKGGGMQGTEDGTLLTGSGNIRNPMRANHHPTVKPIALMRYMIRLVAPRGAVVLDPFMGSGSTGCAAMVEGMQFVGIDITPEYVDIARRRLAWWSCSLDGNAIMKTEENDE